MQICIFWATGLLFFSRFTAAEMCYEWRVNAVVVWFTHWFIVAMQFSVHIVIDKFIMNSVIGLWVLQRLMAGNTDHLPKYSFHACVFELCDACVDTSTGKLQIPYAGDASSENPACKTFFTAHCPVLRMYCSEFISKCSAYFCNIHRNNDCWIHRHRSAEHWKYSFHAHKWRTHKICGNNFENNKNRISIRAIFYFYSARIRNFL